MLSPGLQYQTAFFVATTVLLSTTGWSYTVHPGNIEVNRAYANEPQFAPSGFCIGFNADGTPVASCGGVTVIDPFHVILSFHGTVHNDVPYDKYGVVFGPVARSSQAIMATDYIPAPGAASNGRDYAILRFSEPLPVPAAKLYTGDIVVGETAIHSAGYGYWTDAGSGTINTTDFKKHGVCNIVHATGASNSEINDEYMLARFQRPGHSMHEPLGGSGLNLNSGDGAFIEVGDEFHLAGLAVQVDGLVGDYASLTAYLIFDATDRAWIEQTICQVYSGADSDGDGMSNLQESAFGSNPFAASSLQQPADIFDNEMVAPTDGNPRKLRLHYIRLAGGAEVNGEYRAGRITYIGETSTDATNWTPIGVSHATPGSSTLNAPEGYELGTIEIDASGARGFLRLLVTHAP